MKNEGSEQQSHNENTLTVSLRRCYLLHCVCGLFVNWRTQGA